mmetsp:Transcript_55299/g.179307  ORF Transcript_55299/g.179307 Transcript_55299/m.179307 type:complete len:165 (-) Transcript_55299:51-545(-)
MGMPQNWKRRLRRVAAPTWCFEVKTSGCGHRQFRRRAYAQELQDLPIQSTGAAAAIDEVEAVRTKLKMAEWSLPPKRNYHDAALVAGRLPVLGVAPEASDRSEQPILADKLVKVLSIIVNLWLTFELVSLIISGERIAGNDHVLSILAWLVVIRLLPRSNRCAK